MRVSVAFACLLSMGCASETQKKPVSAVTAHDSKSVIASSLPLPDTAFTSDAPAGSAVVESDRFAPRRIGPSAEESSAHRYGGARIDLDVKGADLQDVFRLIADVGKVNIVVSGDVSGTITMKLARVPWDQALDVVARAKGLTLERDGNVIIVHAH